MSTGRRILSSLFGSNETAITHTLGTETGLPSGVSSSLLAMAAPMVMGYFSRRLRGGTDGLTMGGLSSLLQREIPAIRAALPASLVALLWPREREREPVAAPMVHRAATAEHTSGRWVLPVVLLCLIPALWWMFNHARRPVIVVPTPGGTANRMIPEAPRSNLVLPAPVVLYFNMGSSALQPGSQARLDQFASAIKGNRDIHVNVNGYTDNVGDTDSNMRLSQSRADAVAADLENRGISGGEVTAKGFGEDNPIADNTTVDGRSQNRRVTVEAGR
jgi:outer membrane protein OmpA-like peptidoglycan-associated protein